MHFTFSRKAKNSCWSGVVRCDLDQSNLLYLPPKRLDVFYSHHIYAQVPLRREFCNNSIADGTLIGHFCNLICIHIWTPCWRAIRKQWNQSYAATVWSSVMFSLSPKSRDFDLCFSTYFNTAEQQIRKSRKVAIEEGKKFMVTTNHSYLHFTWFLKSVLLQFSHEPWWLRASSSIAPVVCKKTFCGLAGLQRMGGRSSKTIYLRRRPQFAPFICQQCCWRWWYLLLWCVALLEGDLKLLPQTD